VFPRGGSKTHPATASTIHYVSIVRINHVLTIILYHRRILLWWWAWYIVFYELGIPYINKDPRTTRTLRISITWARTVGSQSSKSNDSNWSQHVARRDVAKELFRILRHRKIYSRLYIMFSSMWFTIFIIMLC